MASFVFELFPVGRQFKEKGFRGPRLGPAVVSGNQSERQGVCPLPKPRLISWRNSAGLGGPSLDAVYELGRFVLLDWELHGSMGSHALSLALSLSLSLFHYVSLVPPTFLSLNLSLSSLFTPFPLPSSSSLNSFSPAGPQRAETHHCCCRAPREICPGFFYFCKVLSRIHRQLLINTPQRLLCLSELTDPLSAMAQQSAELSHC